jgi:hypothetical protein
MLSVRDRVREIGGWVVQQLDKASSTLEKAIRSPEDEERRQVRVIRNKEQRIHQPFYDTWCSWARDSLESPRLFMGSSTPCKDLTNYEGQGAFPADQRFAVKRVGIQVEASSPELKAVVERGVSATLLISSRWMGQWTAEYLRAEGGFVRIGKDIPIPARNNFYIQLDFSSEAYRALKAVKDVVGPGCGWARVKVTLDGILTRAAY